MITAFKGTAHPKIPCQYFFSCGWKEADYIMKTNVKSSLTGVSPQFAWNMNMIWGVGLRGTRVYFPLKFWWNQLKQSNDKTTKKKKKDNTTRKMPGLVMKWHVSSSDSSQMFVTAAWDIPLQPEWRRCLPPLWFILIIIFLTCCCFGLIEVWKENQSRS